MKTKLCAAQRYLVCEWSTLLYKNTYTGAGSRKFLEVDQEKKNFNITHRKTQQSESTCEGKKETCLIDFLLQNRNYFKKLK